MPHTPLPVIAQVYRCALNWVDSNGQHAVNVIHIAADSAGKTPLQVFTCLDAHVTSTLWGPVATSAVVQRVDITPLDGTTSQVQFLTGNTAKWTGHAGGDAMIQVAGLIKFQTGVRGRDNRGRIYLPFVSEDAQNNGQLAGTVPGDTTAAWTTFAAAIDADGTTPMNLVVAAYDRAHSGAGAHATAVASIVCELQTGTMRKRQQRNRA